jgi:hypothetical protein
MYFLHFDARTAKRHTYFTILWMAASEPYGLTGMVYKLCILRTVKTVQTQTQNKAKQNKNKNSRRQNL